MLIFISFFVRTQFPDEWFVCEPESLGQESLTLDRRVFMSSAVGRIQPTERLEVP